MKNPHRRRREKKTNYKSRLALLKSGTHRLVLRKSLNHFTAQIIEYKKEGDLVLVSAHSSQLKKFGWKQNTGNIPAAYLTGFLLAKKANKKKIKNAVLDTGLQESTKGSRIYAGLRGVLDGGLIIPHSDDVLPSEERIRGKKEKISQNLLKVKEKINKV